MHEPFISFLRWNFPRVLSIRVDTQPSYGARADNAEYLNRCCDMRQRMACQIIKSERKFKDCSIEPLKMCRKDREKKMDNLIDTQKTEQAREDGEQACRNTYPFRWYMEHKIMESFSFPFANEHWQYFKRSQETKTCFSLNLFRRHS